MPKLTYKALFERYRDDTVLNKCRRFAHWTLPQLMADVSLTARGTTVQLERDYQEIGALLTNNLASKLASLLFPNSRPFYRIELSKDLLAHAKKRGTSDEDLAAGLAKLELKSCKQLFLNGSYEQLVIAMKHLIVTGNVLLYRNSKTKRTIAYGIQSYSVKRDGQGHMLDCILREYTDFESVSPEVQAVLRYNNPGKFRPENEGRNTVELYTRIKREYSSAGKPIYCVSQEADNVPVGTPGHYPEHLCPWQAIPWSLIAGEHYGRGLVEDYAGGFAKLSVQAEAGTLYTVEACKLVNLVNPGMGADVDELQEAETGEYVSGSAESVTAHEGGDARKMEQMEAQQESTFGRLARAFMYKANTRNAERVTAFEIQQDALEAEATLGGTYSSLSASMQVPNAHVLLTEVDDGMLEGLLTGEVTLDIEAGIAALGRQTDVINLARAAQDAAAIVPVLAQLSNRIDKDKLLTKILSGQSVDVSEIYKSKDQMAEEAAAQQQEAAGQAQIAQSTTLADQQQQLQAIQG